MTDVIRSGLPPHIAAKICGHAALDTTMGYAAIYPEDVISHHRAFIARRRTERPSEEYRELTATEWDEFLAHFELRKVALGICGRDYATPCQHENACVRCPLLLVDPAQMPRLQEIHANLVDRLQEARDQGWLGEVAAIETTMAAAQKLEAMRNRAAQPSTLACHTSAAALVALLRSCDRHGRARSQHPRQGPPLALDTRVKPSVPPSVRTPAPVHPVAWIRIVQCPASEFRIKTGK